MKKVLAWLTEHDADLVRHLAELVAVPSISTDGAHQQEIDQCADLTCRLMREAGLNNVEVLRSGNSNPYAYGEWLGAPGKPTVFLYSHNDVQPINYEADWKSPPWTLTERDGKLFARGTCDMKAFLAIGLALLPKMLERPLKRPFHFAISYDEEVGCAGVGSMIDRMVTSLPPVHAVIVGEPSENMKPNCETVE